MRHLRPPVLALLFLCAAACEPSGIRVKWDSAAPPRDTLVVYAAASLAVPVRAAVEGFAAREMAAFQVEHGASIELARRITELHRVPDVIAVADEEVFPQLLEPAYVTWHASFAGNRIVVAYTERSRGADQMNASSWYRELLRRDVTLGRSDPEIAPVGYRALLMYELAESWYHVPGLAAQLAARTTPGLMRGNASDLASLLEAGELDYIVDYESVARAHRFRWIDLPPAVNLGDAAHAADYARASVRVKRGKDSVTVRGAPIRYALSIPRGAPHPSVALRFASFLMGKQGQAVLMENGLSGLASPEFHGDSVPPSLSAGTP